MKYKLVLSEKFSITKKILSLLMAVFAVCLLTICVSVSVKAAGTPSLTLSNADTVYSAANYICLESAQDMGEMISGFDLRYSTTDPKVENGDDVNASYIGMSEGKYLYVVKKTFPPASTVYLKYQNEDVLVGVTAPLGSTTVSQTDATTKSVTVSWKSITGADGYFIYAGKLENPIKLQYAGETTGTSYTVSGLSQDGKYVVGVVPYKSNGRGFRAAYLPGITKKEDARTVSGKISGLKLPASDENMSRYQILWSRKGADNATGFEILITNKSGKKITGATEETFPTYTFINKKLRTQGWKVKVRAYTKLDNGKKVYGAWSAEKVIVPNAYIKKAKLTGKNNVKITWTKVSGAGSYTVYRSTNPISGYKKIATVKGTNYMMKNLSIYADYYVYVKANKVKIGKKNYNSTSVQYPGYRRICIYTKHF